MIKVPIWILGCDDAEFRQWQAEFGPQCTIVSLRKICNDVGKVKPLMFATTAALMRMWVYLCGSRIAWSVFLNTIRKAIDTFLEDLSAKPIVVHVPRLLIPKVLVSLRDDRVRIDPKAFYVLMPTQETFDAIPWQDVATCECDIFV